MVNKFTSVDIFCGAGGMSTGANMAGITPLLAIEVDPHATATYKKNHPGAIVLQKDISTVIPKDYVNENVFVLFGGPPCQGFSVANTKTRSLENPNNWMFKEYIRFVKDLKPNWFVFENVEGFKTFNKSKFAQEVEKELGRLGYETSSAVLDASNFGVPQKRNRFFIIGHLKSKGGIKFNFNNMEHLEAVTVNDALSDLPSLSNGELTEVLNYKHPPTNKYTKLMRKNSNKATQNFVTKSKDHIIERYKAIKQGENWKVALEKGLLNTYTSTHNTHSGIYRRLLSHKPSVTISNYRKSMLIHPIEHRGLSVREAARLQSFPDNFIFEGPLSFQQQQVGNAVPPLLAKAIFQKIITLEKTLI